MGAGLEKTIALADEPATLALGAAWGTILRPQNPPWIIFLKGDLGAGKTTLVRGFLRGMGYSGNVKSPTYTLVESYPFDLFDPLVYKPISFPESQSGTYIPVFDDLPSLESTPLLGIRKNLLANLLTKGLGCLLGHVADTTAGGACNTGRTRKTNGFVLQATHRIISKHLRF